MMFAPFAILLAAGQTPPKTAIAQDQPAPTAQTATGSPADTVTTFLAFNKAGRLGTPAARPLISGELNGMTARTLGPLASPDKIVAVSPRLSIARLPATRENPADVYLYVVQSAPGAWTIDAIRALALPPFVATLRNDLIQRVTLSEGEQQTLAQINLMMQSDANLRGWFAEHRAELDALRTIALAEPTTVGTARTIESDAARKALGRLNASSLAMSESGAVTVTLSGILDNTVGFLFADIPNKVPTVDGGEYIWIEAIGGGWYLFKTT